MNPNTKMLIAAAVAAALAIAGYYGLVSPQQAASIQNQANQTLGTGPVSQQQPGTPPMQGQAPAPVPTNRTAPGSAPEQAPPPPR